MDSRSRKWGAQRRYALTQTGRPTWNSEPWDDDKKCRGSYTF